MHALLGTADQTVNKVRKKSKSHCLQYIVHCYHHYTQKCSDAAEEKLENHRQILMTIIVDSNENYSDILYS